MTQIEVIELCSEAVSFTLTHQNEARCSHKAAGSEGQAWLFLELASDLTCRETVRFDQIRQQKFGFLMIELVELFTNEAGQSNDIK